MSTKAKPRKALTPEQKAAKAAKAKATREAAALAAAAKANELPVQSINLPKEVEIDSAPIIEALKAGEFDKAIELTNAIPEEDISPENRQKILDEIKVMTLLAAKKSEAPPPEPPKPAASLRPAKQPKVITPNEVMEKWGSLVDILKRYRNQQQKKGKAHRHIHQAFFKSEQFMKRFARFLPD